jgi:hypothetical protein
VGEGSGVIILIANFIFKRLGGDAFSQLPSAVIGTVDQWLNRLQNRDRRFMLSITTVGVGLRKSAQPSVSVFSNLLNRHRKSVKTDGFL